MHALSTYTLYDARNYLLHLAAYLQTQQRSFLQHDTVFKLLPSMVTSLDLILANNPDYQMDPVVNVRFDDATASYAALKERPLNDLLDVVFGLFKPVYTELMHRRELPSDTAFFAFVLAVMADVTQETP